MWLEITDCSVGMVRNHMTCSVGVARDHMSCVGVARDH